MNIFVLDLDADTCAKWHLDKHVVKMPLETAQLLCTALVLNGAEASYKIAHKNHPCSIWARETQSNFLWLANLGLKLCAEYTYRYEKTHACLRVIEDCITKVQCIPSGELTNFVQAMPDQYKRENPVEGYRAYYVGAKKTLAAWKKREPPWWWPETI